MKRYGSGIIQLTDGSLGCRGEGDCAEDLDGGEVAERDAVQHQGRPTIRGPHGALSPIVLLIYADFMSGRRGVRRAARDPAGCGDDVKKGEVDGTRVQGELIYALTSHTPRSC